MAHKAKRVTVYVEVEQDNSLLYELTEAEWELDVERAIGGPPEKPRYTGQGSVRLNAKGEWRTAPNPRAITTSNLERLENRAILGDRKAAETLVDAFRAYRRTVQRLERVVHGPVADLQIEAFFEATKKIEEAPEAVEVPT